MFSCSDRVWFAKNVYIAVYLGSWRSYKQLLSVVESAILKKQPEAYYDLDGVLKRFKSELLSPLRNPVSVFVVMLFWGGFVQCSSWSSHLQSEIGLKIAIKCLSQHFKIWTFIFVHEYNSVYLHDPGWLGRDERWDSFDLLQYIIGLEWNFKWGLKLLNCFIVGSVVTLIFLFIHQNHAALISPQLQDCRVWQVGQTTGI